MNKIVLKIKSFLSKLTAKLGSENTHTLCSFVITFVFGLLGIIFGIFVGCLAGLAKEMYSQVRYTQHQEGEGFNKENLAYDIIGISIAVIVLLLI